MAKPIGSNKENLEKTRAHLLLHARKCFAEHGYQNTSTTMVIESAASSRGSLYHHFTDKQELFRAVYDVLCQEIVQRITQHPYQNEEALPALIEGCAVYLKCFTNNDFARILLIDGPNVLGIEYCRAQDRATAYALLKEGVVEIVGNNVEATYIADFVSGALDSYALHIAEAKQREKIYKEYAKAFALYANKLLA